MKVLIICTENSCLSPMAEAFLKKFDPNINVVSAGIKPAKYVHPLTIQAMKEVGIDLSNYQLKDINEVINDNYGYVITLCDDAKRNLPNFYGDVRNRLHISFTDPALLNGKSTTTIDDFREVRDNIKKEFHKFYNDYFVDSYLLRDKIKNIFKKIF